MVKRPLGLKTTKAKKKSRPVPDDAAPSGVHQASGSGNPGTPYTTVALPVSSAAAKDTDSAEDDGLTIDDLLELKSQAEDHLASVRLLATPESAVESCNLLRGICHECYRRIELATSSETVQEPTMSFLAWATLQLGLFLTPLEDKPLTELILPGEPDTLEGWCAITSRALAATNNDANAFSGHFTMVQPMLNLVLALRDPNSQDVLARLKTWGTAVAENLSKPQLSIGQGLSHIANALELIEAVSPDWDDHLVKSHGQNVFDELRTLLDTLAATVASLPASEEPLDNNRVTIIRYMITRHLAHRALLHGSALAESMEDQYFPESEEESGAEDEFPIDTSNPEYQNTLIALNLAEKHFSTAIELMESDSVLKDMKYEAAEELKTQLSETLFTLGNMLKPGPEREAVYQRASAHAGDLEL